MGKGGKVQGSKPQTALVPRGVGDNGKLPQWITGGLPWDLDRVTEELSFLLARTLEDLFQVGRRLIWAQHELGQGNFEKWLEENFPMHRATAYRYIATARKIGPYGADMGTMSQLRHLGRSKIYALLDADESEIKRFMKEGKLYGLEADEVDRMSVAELRDAVRKNRKNKKRYLDSREEIRALQAELETYRKDVRTADEEAVCKAIRSMKYACLNALSLADRVDTEKSLKVKATLSGALEEIRKRAEGLQYDKCLAEEDPHNYVH